MILFPYSTSAPYSRSRGEVVSNETIFGRARRESEYFIKFQFISAPSRI